MSASDTEAQRIESSPPVMVGIGASAGGIEALNELFTNLDSRTGLAFLVAVHLDRSHQSFLGEILSKKTPMRVNEAANASRIESNQVYVITPNTSIEVAGGSIVVKPRMTNAGLHMPVDALFNSLASDQGKNSMGIVLSGTGTDGALGIQSIKGRGGITFAQDQSTARFDGMPQSAISSGCVDFVLPPTEIARELVRIAQHPYLAEDTPEDEAPISEDQWKRFFRILRGSSGLDFSYYKRATINRRLLRRMALRKMLAIPQYLDLLQSDPIERDALYQDFLIRVTGFFRDPATFEGLRGEVFPRIMQDRQPADPVRIWVPGCASGEEAYSIAISLLEFLGDKAAATPIQIFGTDVNAHAVARARRGLYIENIALDVSEERLRRFFVKVDQQYQVSKMIRDLCVFAEHDLASDPPFSKVDLVSCRNVLIYLDPRLQKRVIGTFHYALRSDRFLMLGPAETIGQVADMFELIDKKAKIYRRLGLSARVPLMIPPSDRLPGKRPKATAPAAADQVDVEYVQREADHLLLARYAPAGVLVDESMNVLQFRGKTTPYLEHRHGAASLSLPKLIHPKLLVDVSAAIADARNQSTPVRKEGLRIEADGVERRIALEVVPMKSGPNSARCFLILFGDDSAARETAAPPKLPARLGRWLSRSRGESQVVSDSPDIEELKRELESTRSYLNAVVEANEAAQEELRSSNEEALSANEEFQSTNEELETAKEELQSANEELSTTNEELRNRNLEMSEINVQLRESRDHAQAIVDTARAPLILLDRDLRVRGVNRAYCEMFDAIAEETEDCLFFELGGGEWKVQGLADELHAVIERGVPIEGKEIEIAFPRLGTRSLVLYARRLVGDVDYNELVLLTIVDITEREHSQERLRQQGELLDLSHDAILAWELDGPIRYWNRGAEELYGWTADEAKGKSPDMLLKTLRGMDYAKFVRKLSRDGRWTGEQVHTKRDGRTIIVDAVCTLAQQGGMTLILESNRDVTEKKAAEDGLRQHDRLKDEFLAMLSHELRNPLGPVRNAVYALRQEPGDPALVRKLHDMIDRQVTKLVHIVDDLLEVSRVARGYIELRKENVDVVDVVRGAIAAMRDQIAGHGHEIIETLPDKELRAVIDPTRIEQVVVNLLDNAAKYSPDASRIEVALAEVDQSVVIRVKDNGMGIPGDMLPHIFDKFAQVGIHAHHREGGLGLGLTLARQLVELHEGTVIAKSGGVDEGSEFIVTLPRGDYQSSAPVGAVSDAQANPTTSRHRLLVVDDNVDAADSTAILLREWGHEVSIANDGTSALERAAEFKPDVVLLDIGLPDMSGYELAPRLRALPALPKEVFLVAITGYGAEHDRRRAGEAGFNRHMTKPVELEVLKDLLASIPAASARRARS